MKEFRTHVIHNNINCASCRSYQHCTNIENRFKSDIVANEGNWRNISEADGKRIETPIRRCSLAILEKWSHLFENSDVLEIGCGPSSAVNEEFCSVHRTRYIGIDPARLPSYELPWIPFKSLQRRVLGNFVSWGLHQTSRHRQFILDRFPSPKLSGRAFDLIYSTSSLEHWHEDLTDRDKTILRYRRYIDECWNLLRPGGVMVMDAPMFLHGNIWFMRGDVEMLESFFGNKWQSIVFEHWREQYDELMPYCPKRRQRAFREEFGIDLHNIWILNIVATK